MQCAPFKIILHCQIVVPYSCLAHLTALADMDLILWRILMLHGCTNVKYVVGNITLVCLTKLSILVKLPGYDGTVTWNYVT